MTYITPPKGVSVYFCTKTRFMLGNETASTIVLILILLHFVAGFGFLAWKLSGKPKEEEEQNK